MVILLILGMFFLQPFLPAFRREVAVQLLFGWIGFIRNVLFRAQVSWPAVMLAAGLLLVLLACFHWLMRWMYRQWGADRPGASLEQRDSGTRRWRMSWSVSTVGIIILVFVTGVAATAAVHHILWLSQDVVAQDFLKQRRGRW